MNRLLMLVGALIALAVVLVLLLGPVGSWLWALHDWMRTLPW